MKIELFTLCEGAFNTNGRLTIVNTFEDIIANQYPWRGQLGMALKLLIPKDEIKDYSFQVRIQSADFTQTFHEMNAELKLSQSIDQGDVRIALATNIQGLLLPVAGDYRCLSSPAYLEPRPRLPRNPREHQHLRLSLIACWLSAAR